MRKNKDAGEPRDSGRAQLLVVPGEDLGDSQGLEPGHGVMEVDGRIRALKRGTMRKNGSYISVEPTHTRYFPRPSDLVIGHIEGCTNNIWFVDIGAPFNAILPMSLGPGKAEFGGTRSIMDVGDSILCRVQEVEETHSSVVTMKGMGLRKIRSGSIEEVDPHLLGRLIGKGGQSLRELKEETECRIVVADNGRMWVDGDLPGILQVRDKLQLLSMKSKQNYAGGRN
jgi:exosome complex component RRP4|tara:strand:+ start:15892 stop:16569 length:678 start_codon:yes stop_codon:yes gene_type:complete